MKIIHTAALLALVGATSVAIAQERGTTKPARKAATAAAPTTTKAATASGGKITVTPTTDPTAAYEQLAEVYLSSDFSNMKEALRVAMPLSAKMTVKQRLETDYIRVASMQQRPEWWEKTKSSSNISFNSKIWDRSIMTNYVPDDEMGVQAPVAIQDGRLVTVVAWRPTNVDNPRAAEGALAKKLGTTKGDIGEVVVWHELGHNFITTSLTAQQALDLYRNQRVLFHHLQEFFADMTSVHHASAKARRATMVLRLDSLDPPFGPYRELEPHTRAAHAIGAGFLAEVLSDPAKWPNVHLPPEVPADSVELKTIIYVYEHFDAKWSVEEDKALRDWAGKLVRTQGDAIFKSKGLVPLAQKQNFSLTEAQDREHQKKRDAWVAEKLKKAIADGRADKAGATTKAVGPRRYGREMRIEVPMY